MTVAPTTIVAPIDPATVPLRPGLAYPGVAGVHRRQRPPEEAASATWRNSPAILGGFRISTAYDDGSRSRLARPAPSSGQSRPLPTASSSTAPMGGFPGGQAGRRRLALARGRRRFRLLRFAVYRRWLASFPLISAQESTQGRARTLHPYAVPDSRDRGRHLPVSAHAGPMAHPRSPPTTCACSHKQRHRIARSASRLLFADHMEAVRPSCRICRSAPAAQERNPATVRSLHSRVAGEDTAAAARGSPDQHVAKRFSAARGRFLVRGAIAVSEPLGRGRSTVSTSSGGRALRTVRSPALVRASRMGAVEDSTRSQTTAPNATRRNDGWERAWCREIGSCALESLKSDCSRSGACTRVIVSACVYRDRSHAKHLHAGGDIPHTLVRWLDG